MDSRLDTHTCVQGLSMGGPRQLQLSPPSDGARLVSVSLTASALAALWDDSSLQLYDSSAAAFIDSHSSGLSDDAPSRQEAALRCTHRLRDFFIPARHTVRSFFCGARTRGVKRAAVGVAADMTTIAMLPNPDCTPLSQF